MGLYLAIFTIFSIVGIFVLNNKLKKVFSNYYVMAIFGIIFFIYFWIVRYQEDIMNFINGTTIINGINDPNLIFQDRWHSIKFSKALLLDLCPFVAMVYSFLLTFDRKKNILKIIAPYGFFGGCITIFGQIIGDEVGTTSNNLYTVTNGWDFIFGNKAYFSMHYFSIVISIIVLMNSKGFDWLDISGTIIFPLTYFAYIMIIVTQFDVTQNATGLVSGDWGAQGQYGMVGILFQGIAFPWLPTLCYTLVYIYVIIWIILRNTFINDVKWKSSKMIVSTKISLFLNNILWEKINNKKKIENEVIIVKCLKCNKFLKNFNDYDESQHNHDNCDICRKANINFCNEKCFK